MGISAGVQYLLTNLLSIEAQSPESNFAVFPHWFRLSWVCETRNTLNGESKMKRLTSAFALTLAFSTGAVLSAQVHDWHDLDAVHKHVIESIHEMERARAANHYDMQGHGAKAEDHLRAAERELGLAVDASKASAP
jgi:hypothetical protein